MLLAINPSAHQLFYCLQRSEPASDVPNALASQWLLVRVKFLYTQKRENMERGERYRVAYLILPEKEIAGSSPGKGQ